MSWHPSPSVGRQGLLILVALSLVGCAAPDIDDAVALVPPTTAPVASSAQPTAKLGTTPALVNRTTTFGSSVQGRPLTVTEIGDPNSARRVLIVGCIHGNERAGIAITTALLKSGPLNGVDVWILPVLNPDGALADTRQNANGVDLNRNFPFRWQPLGRRGAIDYSGTAALSEPEAAAAAKLITRIHPTLGIWFHQHEAVVDDSQGPLAVEQRFSQLVGLRLSRLADYPGSVTGWQDASFGPTAFVVELPAGQLSAAAVQRYVDAVRTVATGL